MLKKEYGGYVLKVHGGMYQKTGVPDILWWYKNKSFAFEVKRPVGTYKVTALQLHTLNELSKQGVYTAVVRSPKEVEDVIKNTPL